MEWSAKEEAHIDGLVKKLYVNPEITEICFYVVSCGKKIKKSEFKNLITH